MKSLLIALSAFTSLNALAYEITSVDTSSYSSDYACYNAHSKGERDADAACRARDPKSFLSTFQPQDRSWQKLPNGDFRCMLKSYYSCY